MFKVQIIKNNVMKTIRNSFVVFLLLTIGINSATFAGNSDKTEIRNVKSFNAIKVTAGIDLYLKMGSVEEVKVIADDDIIDNIITEVKDGTLRIYSKKTNWFSWSFNETRKVYVTVKKLERIDASSGSDVRSENTLKGEDLKISASSGSNVSIDVIFKNIWLDTSSGSDAKLSGKVKIFYAEASSGSDVKAQNLESKICKVAVSSGSDATINVTDELYAKASSGADVRYYGNPGVKEINESSGGNIRSR